MTDAETWSQFSSLRARRAISTVAEPLLMRQARSHSGKVARAFSTTWPSSMRTSSIMAAIETRLASRWLEKREDELELGWVTHLLSSPGEARESSAWTAIGTLRCWPRRRWAGAPPPAPAGGERATGGREGGDGGRRSPFSEEPALEAVKGSGPESITGSVTDAGGQPVGGVWVTAEEEAGEQETGDGKQETG